MPQPAEHALALRAGNGGANAGDNSIAGIDVDAGVAIAQGLVGLFRLRFGHAAVFLADRTVPD
jgi:hypothetical protein